MIMKPYYSLPSESSDEFDYFEFQSASDHSALNSCVVKDSSFNANITALMECKQHLTKGECLYHNMCKFIEET